MKPQILLYTVIASSLMFGCQSQLPSSSEIIRIKSESPVDSENSFFTNQLIVRMDERASLDSVFQSVSEAKFRVIDEVKGRSIYLLEVRGDTAADQLVSKVKAQAGVQQVSLNRVVELKAATNDLLLKQQWAVQNDGQEAPHSLPGIAGADINMDWSVSGSSEVVVAVIDTGIDYLHEDLAVIESKDGANVPGEGSNIWVNPDEIPGNDIDDDNNGYVDDVYGYNFADRNGDPMDDNGHGTHCAGVIGAKRNNYKGIAGINDHVSLMALKFLSSSGSGGTFEAIQALYYLIDIQKRFPDKKFITSNSWGSAGREATSDEDDTLLMAFLDAGEAGILSFAAAGNDGTSNRFFKHYPSNYSSNVPNIVSVAATDNMDKLTSFSSYGYGEVDLAAPGELIMSTVPKKLFPAGYAAWSGTSMATPQVSAMAALVWANNMQMSASDLKDRILSTVDVLPSLQGLVTTGGRMNVGRALENDANVFLSPIEEEQAYVVESPRSRDKYEYDLMIEVKADEGAEETSVCFSDIWLEPDYDWIEIYSSDYRIIDTISGTYLNINTRTRSRRELCSAPVPGDKLYIRVYNDGSEKSGPHGFKTSHLKVKR